MVKSKVKTRRHRQVKQSNLTPVANKRLHLTAAKDAAAGEAGR